MAPHGFIELRDGSAATLRRMLILACRWSRVRKVYIWPVGVSHAEVEMLLRVLMEEEGGRLSAVDIVPEEDRFTATRRAHTAAYCLLGSAALASQTHAQQVSVSFLARENAGRTLAE
jgi:hypothetical protein